MKKSLTIIFLFVLFYSCSTENQNISDINCSIGNEQDPHSYANISEASTEHLNLDLTVNFDKKILNGSVEHYIKQHNPTSIFKLDILDLNIDSVLINGKKTDFQIGESVKYFGQCLSINIEHNTEKVKIFYQTSPNAAALQWIDAEKTLGKKHPFLYSQSQAILARSWIPIQDAPSVKFTYAAQIQTPNGLMALMSAENPQEISSDGIYQFQMKEPVSSYLMAIAVGNIDFKKIGENTGIYAEPEILTKAYDELVDMQEMVYQAEELYGAYKWGRFDVLIMPPSFPFGGMENPMLTFATPTILAGDKSLVSLIAHELAHSWSGNLVTNETWNDFWLNEGFTVYFESRIMEKIYGKSYDDMLKVLGLMELEETIAEFEKENKMEETHLYLNLANRNPDDGLTDIAYEKGRFFLYTLENLVGREKFDLFLNQYFSNFSFQTTNTQSFIEYLYENLLISDSLKKAAQVDQWVFGPGIPDNFPGVTSNEFEQIEEIAQQLNAGTISISSIKTNGFTTHHWQRLLRSLDKLDSNVLRKIDSKFNLSQQNAEIAFDWFLLALKNDFHDIKDPLKDYLLKIGRRKFVAPLFREIVKNESLKAWSLEWYPQARKMYHSVTYNTVDEILGYNKK
jgi:aminopeptidase N